MVRRFNISKKIHVLHVSTAMSWRGGEQQVVNLLSELFKMDVLQCVLCSKGSEMEDYCIRNAIDYFSLTKGSSLNLLYAKKLSKLCTKLQVDICHLHDAHAHTYAILAATFFKNYTPLILSRRVDFPIKKNWASNYKYNHSSIRKIICVSETIKKITAKGIRDKSKLMTIYSGIDINKFRNNGSLQREFHIKEDILLVGNTSALANHKDYFTFLDTAKILIDQKQKIKFFIFGKGPLENEIRNYIKEKKLEASVILAGFRIDIHQLLGDLDVFLMTSKTEGLGTSILDAFAAGVPVVATNAGGIHELVENASTGLICPIKDSNCLAESVLKFISDKVFRENVIQAAQTKVKSFSKENTAVKTLSVYREVLGIKALD